MRLDRSSGFAGFLGWPDAVPSSLCSGIAWLRLLVRDQYATDGSQVAMDGKPNTSASPISCRMIKGTTPR